MFLTAETLKLGQQHNCSSACPKNGADIKEGFIEVQVLLFEIYSSMIKKQGLIALLFMTELPILCSLN